MPAWTGKRAWPSITATPQWQADVIAHFEYNLRRIVRIADEAGVPLLFVSPVSNLQFAPFKSEHRADHHGGRARAV